MESGKIKFSVDKKGKNKFSIKYDGGTGSANFLRKFMGINDNNGVDDKKLVNFLNAFVENIKNDCPPEGIDCEFERDSSGNIAVVVIDGHTYKNPDVPTENVGGNAVDSGGKADNVPSGEDAGVGSKIGHIKNVPQDTKLYLENLKNQQDIENFALNLNKLAISEGVGNKEKFYFFKTDKGKIVYSINYSFSKVNFTKINENRNLVKSMYNNNSKYDTIGIKRKTDWRLIVGLGSESVYETSIALHHTYGVPYIPSSGIKGAFRNFIVSEYFDGEEKEAMKDDVYKYIFGDTDHRGNVIFIEALPTSNHIKLNFDVMNPHYSEYYSGKKQPADYLSPVPIPFIVVENTEFDFFFAVKKPTGDNKNIKSDKLDIEDLNTFLEAQLEAQLMEMLANHGLGAKTSVGYGYF